MTSSLSTPSSLRQRAAKCRALADGRITRLDASEWLRLAEEWERLADRVEAHVSRLAIKDALRWRDRGD